MQPSRDTDSTSTLPDNIFSSDVSSKVTNGYILIQISDDFPQFSFLKNPAPVYTNCSQLIDDHKTFDQSQFLDKYQNTDFGFSDSEEQNLDTKLDKLLGSLNYPVNEHCPKKRLNQKL